MKTIHFANRKRRYWLLPSCIFVSLAIALWVSVSGQITSITSDFDFYNHSIVKIFNGHVSDLSLAIDQQSVRIARDQHLNWSPSPVYGILFLWPIWLLGSQGLYWLIGVAIGVISIKLVVELLARLSISIPRVLGWLMLISFSFNFNFVVDSAGVSSMSIMSMLFLAAFSTEKRVCRVLMLILASTLRANYIFVAFAIFATVFIFRLKIGKAFLLDLIPSLFSWFIAYSLYFSSYPGGGINYLFWTAAQGIDYSQASSLGFLSPYLGVSTERQLFEFPMSLSNLISILHLQEAWAFLVSAFALKMSITLGFTHEKLFDSFHEIFITKIWRVVYFVSISLPGFYALIFNIFSPRFAPVEKSIYLASIIYLCINSVLIGDPRYSIGIHFFLSLSLARLLDQITSTGERQAIV